MSEPMLIVCGRSGRELRVPDFCLQAQSWFLAESNWTWRALYSGRWHERDL